MLIRLATVGWDWPILRKCQARYMLVTGFLKIRTGIGTLIARISGSVRKKELRVMIPRVITFLVMLPLLAPPGLNLCQPACPMSLHAGDSHDRRSRCSSEGHHECQQSDRSNTAKQNKPVQRSPYDDCCQIGTPAPAELQPQQISQTFLSQTMSSVSTMLALNSPRGESPDLMAGMGALGTRTVPNSPSFTPLRI